MSQCGGRVSVVIQIWLTTAIETTSSVSATESKCGHTHSRRASATTRADELSAAGPGARQSA